MPSSSTAATGHHVELALPGGSIEVWRYENGSLLTPAPIPNGHPILPSKVDQGLDESLGISISNEDIPPRPETPMRQLSGAGQQNKLRTQDPQEKSSAWQHW